MTVAARQSMQVKPLALLVFVTLVAWVALVRLEIPPSRPVAFLAGWGVMMTAMMLPSAAPLVRVYGRRGRGTLVLGYLLVWGLTGLPVYAVAATVDLMNVPHAAAAAVLALAAAYQFTRLKNVCLRSCRSPLDFIALRWGRGPFRLGIEHGAYCVGCCWALMAVLVGAAAMDLTVAAVIAAVVFAEKVLPAGESTARVADCVLLGASIVILM